MPVKKLAVGLVIGTIIALYFVGGGEKYFDIHLYQDLFERSPLATAAIFFLLFFVGTACSLPVTGVMSLASGIVFGHFTGFVISLIASTLGGTLALISVRVLFYDFIQRKFAGSIELVNKGIEKEGAMYVFSLRMIPVIPFWVLNLLVGLTSMRAPVFFLATLLGMIPVMLILTYAGSQVGEIESLSMSAIFTPGMIIALCLMASFPVLAKFIVALARKRT